MQTASTIAAPLVGPLGDEGRRPVRDRIRAPDAAPVEEHQSAELGEPVDETSADAVLAQELHRDGATGRDQDHFSSRRTGMDPVREMVLAGFRVPHVVHASLLTAGDRGSGYSRSYTDTAS